MSWGGWDFSFYFFNFQAKDILLSLFLTSRLKIFFHWDTWSKLLSVLCWCWAPSENNVGEWLGRSHRSRRPQVFCKKGGLGFYKIHRKALVLKSLFNKVAGLNVIKTYSYVSVTKAIALSLLFILHNH